MLQIDRLDYQVRGKALLDTCELTLKTGSFTAVLGPNGAGKSTLLKAIAGDLPQAGQIRLHGKALNQWQNLERARHLAVLPQSSELSFPFQAREVVAMGMTPLSMSKTEGEKAIAAVMQQTDCAHLADNLYPSLSGGERQRVQLARVLLQLSQAEQPPLLLLDEPTSAQDLGQQHRLLTLIKQLCHSQQLTAIAILHDLNQVLRYCDNCWLIDQGQVAAQGEPGKVLTPDTIETHWQYRPAFHAAQDMSQTGVLF